MVKPKSGTKKPTTREAVPESMISKKPAKSKKNEREADYEAKSKESMVSKSRKRKMRRARVREAELNALKDKIAHREQEAGHNAEKAKEKVSKTFEIAQNVLLKRFYYQKKKKKLRGTQELGPLSTARIRDLEEASTVS